MSPNPEKEEVMSKNVFVYTLVCSTDLKGGNRCHKVESFPVPLELGHEVSLEVDSSCTGKMILYEANYVIKRIVHREWVPSDEASETLVFMEMEKDTIEELIAAGAKEDARVTPKGFKFNIEPNG